MPINGLKIHRINSWLLVLFSLITIFLGYDASRHWLPNYRFYIRLHLVFEWIFLISLIIHIILSRKYLKLKAKRMVSGLKSKKARPMYILRLIQFISKWGIVVLAFLVVLSGLMYYEWFANFFDNIIIFSWHVDYDLYLSLFIIVHVAVGLKFFFIRKRKKHWIYNLFIIIFAGSLISVLIYINLSI